MENLPSKTRSSHNHGRSRQWWRLLSDQLIPQWCIKREQGQESLCDRELKLKGRFSAPHALHSLLIHPSPVERLFPANLGCREREQEIQRIFSDHIHSGTWDRNHSRLSLRLIGFGFIPSNTVFCPYMTLPGVPSLPLWKGINNYPSFLPGNTDSEWGEMDSSQGSASSRARGPGPININA